MSFFKRPLGLALSGGGATGAWQAGCLEALEKSGLVFDKIVGFSAGALNGAAYSLGTMDRSIARWQSMELRQAYKLSPMLRPLSFCSPTTVLGTLEDLLPDETAKGLLRNDLTVISLCIDDGMPAYARFSPGGKMGCRPGRGRW